MEAELIKLTLEVDVSKKRGATWSRESWPVLESDKTWYNKEAGVRAIKSQLLKPASAIRNDGLGGFEAHIYFLEGKDQTPNGSADGILFLYLQDRINSIYLNVAACHNRLMSIAPGP